MEQEVRYRYHSPGVTVLLDYFELLKWFVRRVIDFQLDNARLPDILKRRVIASYARRYNLKTFVESGTYLGETIAFMRKYCSRAYSVELQPHLAKAAQARFAADPAVRILQGDGSNLIAQIVGELQEPALFWLDGHFAAGTARDGEVACPTLQEILPVLADTRYAHVLLVDDAREFRGESGYPTLNEMQQFIRSAKADVFIEVKNDIVRVTRAYAT